MESKKINSVLNKELCAGCGSCTYACPKQCIEMITDEKGFMRACVREADCINCGRCLEVCPGRVMPSKLATLAEKHKEEEFVANDSREAGIAASRFVVPQVWSVGTRHNQMPPHIHEGSPLK